MIHKPHMIALNSLTRLLPLIFIAVYVRPITLSAPLVTGLKSEVGRFGPVIR